MSDFPWRFRTVYKFITGASHPGLNCFEPQTTVGVLTVPFSSQDIRRLESSKGHGKSLSEYNTSRISKFKSDLSSHFEISDLGELAWILGIQVKRDRISRTITLSQAAYIDTVVKRFKRSILNPLPHSRLRSIPAFTMTRREEEEITTAPVPGEKNWGDLHTGWGNQGDHLGPLHCISFWETVELQPAACGSANAPGVPSGVVMFTHH